jgi:hypothetical protein
VGHRQEGAHAELLHVGLAQDLHVQGLVVQLAEGASLVGNIGGMADVGRQVAEVAGAVDARGHGLAPGHRLLQAGDGGPVGDRHGDLVKAFVAGLAALEVIEAVAGLDAGADDVADAVVQAEARHLELGQEAHRLARAALQALGGDMGGAHQASAVQVPGLAGADHHHLLGGHPGQGEQGLGLARLALEAGGAQGARQLAGGGLVQRPGGRAQLAATGGDDDRAGFLGGRGAVLELEFHRDLARQKQMI